LGCSGIAWCPTPRAIETLVKAGARPPSAPPVTVLRAVNDRRFSIASLLPDAPYRPVFLSGEAAARRAFDAPSPTGRYLLRQPLGFAGRGRLVTTGFNDRVARFVARSIARFGGVSIEPLYDRTLDASIHGFLSESGDAVIGAPVITEVSNGGVFQGVRRAAETAEASFGELGQALTANESRALRAEAERVASLLHGAGYFGPFGLDGFRYVFGGVTFFAPRCEINARYTMGWATGMGDVRPDLPGGWSQ